MAISDIGHRPDLTPEQAYETFARHFDAKYEVYPTRIRNRDFIVKQSGWCGVGVRLKQEKQRTIFVYTALIPNFLLQALFGGLAAYLFLRSSWKTLEEEITQFIQTAPEFTATAKTKADTTEQAAA
jgi:hypothetical protein